MDHIAHDNLAGLRRIDAGTGQSFLHDNRAQVAGGQLLQCAAEATDCGTGCADEHDFSCATHGHSFNNMNG
jgi:hypothetical protein